MAIDVSRRVEQSVLLAIALLGAARQIAAIVRHARYDFRYRINPSSTDFGFLKAVGRKSLSDCWLGMTMWTPLFAIESVTLAAIPSD